LSAQKAQGFACGAVRNSENYAIVVVAKQLLKVSPAALKETLFSANYLP